jgi:glycosyltransferase involved in cell wall biosynthesis
MTWRPEIAFDRSDRGRFMTKMMRDSMRNILLISNDVIGERMAGPGIRFWEFARALSDDFQVSLAVPNKDHPAGNGFAVSSYTPDEGRLRELASTADVIVFQGFVLHGYPFLAEFGVPLVVDVYDPFVLENLRIHSHETMLERERIHWSDVTVLNSQLQAGDFFLCASEKQRDFWLGMLLALNRVNPYTYDSDETLRTLIDVVPFGLPSSPPEHTKQVLKGIYQTIGRDDKVILWGGGIWDWFDPFTLIRAMATIAARRHDAKLFFMGIKHPNPLIPQMRATSQAIQLSKDLGLYDKFVFFNEWVPYEERQNYLMEADVGVSLHLDHLETRFSFRTRLLDYIWAGLPIVTTRGDSMSELVEQHSLGKVVDYGDAEQVADALMELLDTPNLREVYRPGFEEAKGQFTWERAVEPLARFCANPRLAPDKAASGIHNGFPSPGQSAVRPTPWWALPGRAWYIFSRGGWGALRREVKSYLRFRFGSWPEKAAEEESHLR